MNKYFLICFCLFTLSLSFYRPLSKLNISYPSDICYFKDTTVNSAILNLEFVRGCAKNKKCMKVDTKNSYEIHTCFNSGINKRECDACANQFECSSTQTCGGTPNKCVSEGSTCPTSGGSTPPLCETEGNIYNYAPGHTGCETGKNDKKGFCEIYDSTGSLIGDYKEDSSAKLCGKSTITQKTSTNNYYKEKIEWVYYGSVQDGQFVKDPDACQSGFALYFYGNQNLENPLGSDSVTHEMFLRCVTVLDIEFDEVASDNTKSPCKRIKYKIGSGNELIYDLSNLVESYKSNFICDYSLMIKLELFKKYKEEYDKVKEQCNSEKLNYLCGKDELMKWWYLYKHPTEYLLYKDQTEVLDYLIQAANPTYTPETGKVPETTPVTEPVAITEDETTTEPETESTESSKFLNIKYFIFLLFGLFEL